MIVKRHLPHPYLHWVFSLTEWNKLSPPTYQAKEVSHFRQHFSAVISIFILMAIAFLLWPMYLYLCLFQKTVGIQNNCVIGKSQWSSYRFCKIALCNRGFDLWHLCFNIEFWWVCFVFCETSLYRMLCIVCHSTSRHISPSVKYFSFLKFA